jgi:hypothetical protein
MPKYFALVGADGKVKQVIVAEDDYISANPAEEFMLDGVAAGQGARWLETKMDDPTEKYAGIDDDYHEDIGAFLPKKPHNSWIRDDQKKEWKAPVEMPKNGKEHKWNEAEQKWDVDLVEEKVKEDLKKK